MARLPSMTPQEAESVLGPRGRLIVTSDNRLTVRKWLCAQGIPALAAATLSMRELALDYNQTDGSGLAAIKRKIEESEELQDETPAPAPTPEAPALAPLPLPTPTPENAPAATPATPDVVKLLRDIVLGGYQPAPAVI